MLCEMLKQDTEWCGVSLLHDSFKNWIDTELDQFYLEINEQRRLHSKPIP